VIRFYTENSEYEVQPDTPGPGGEVRRVTGNRPATGCFAPEGEWKRYLAMSFIQEGHPVQILWSEEAPRAATITSFVTRIEEGE
jgi:hypothetical protein